MEELEKGGGDEVAVGGNGLAVFGRDGADEQRGNASGATELHVAQAVAHHQRVVQLDVGEIAKGLVNHADLRLPASAAAAGHVGTDVDGIETEPIICQ